MKQLLALAMLVLITIAATGSAGLVSQDAEMSGQTSEIREVIVDGRELQSCVNALPRLGRVYIDENGRTIVPLRVIADCLDLPIHWEEETKTIQVYGGRDGVVSFQIGSSEYMVGEEKYEMDTTPVLDEGRTHLPLRYVVEGLGGTISATQQDGLTIVAQMPWTSSQATMKPKLKGEEILDLADKLSWTTSTISFLAKTDQEMIFLLNDPATLIKVKDVTGNIERIPLTVEDGYSSIYVALSESRQEFILFIDTPDGVKEGRKKPSCVAFDFHGNLLWEKEVETVTFPREHSEGWAYIDNGTLVALNWEGEEQNRVVIPEQYLGVMTMPHHIGDVSFAIVAASQDGSTKLSVFSRDGKHLRSQVEFAWRNATSFVQGDNEGYIFGSASDNQGGNAVITDRIGVYMTDYYGSLTRVKTLCLPEMYQDKYVTLSYSLASDEEIDLFGVVWNEQGNFEHQFLMRLSQDLEITALHELDVGSYNQVIFAQDTGTEIVMITTASEHLFSTLNSLKIWKVQK